ncbi:MAG: shikimate dehydrogenase [Acidobacteriota bacterium]|nr:shikimate dehydrogenase [Pyrinomonadaceae bacterium]MDW8303698.1 shikimate dehydrogenase [Acidobacteriota bacterium]
MKQICVSICAKSLSELIEKARSVDAEIVELRLDCLDDLGEETVDVLLSLKKCLILTYRSESQGGEKPLKKHLWFSILQRLSSRLKSENVFVDCEYGFPEGLFSDLKKIVSFHSFSGKKTDIQKIYEQMIKSAEIVKVAVMADDALDAIEIWDLLGAAKRDSKKLIPIAMGEGGKWTRILGLAYGAFVTFACLSEEEATAPGQISFREMKEVYRVEDLTEKSEVYGLLAGDTTYSLSPYIHNLAFRHNFVDAVFVPFQTRNIEKFLTEMVAKKRVNFKGFAVTNPHKEKIIGYLDEIDCIASKTEAVNTVKIENGKLKGYNTDVEGFIKPLTEIYGELKNTRVALVGSGGAARSCVYALKNKGAQVTIFSRNMEKAKKLAEKFDVSFAEFSVGENLFDNFDILVNATPTGTKGAYENETIAKADDLKGLHLVYDLVYNPFRTKLMKEAEKACIPAIGGLAMLITQAARQQQIWTGKQPPVEQMSQVALRRITF